MTKTEYEEWEINFRKENKERIQSFHDQCIKMAEACELCSYPETARRLREDAEIYKKHLESL